MLSLGSHRYAILGGGTSFMCQSWIPESGRDKLGIGDLG
jgi:hypothetical protein